MIPRKLKECSVCHDPCFLWVSKPPMCRDCAMKAKVHAKPHKPLVQTISGKQAKPFKAYRTKEIKKVSTRQQKLLTIYTVQAKLYKKNHPICKAQVMCSGALTEDVHHRRGRGEYLLDESTWLPCCRRCHEWIEVNPKQAKALGLSDSRLSKIV